MTTKTKELSGLEAEVAAEVARRLERDRARTEEAVRAEVMTRAKRNGAYSPTAAKARSEQMARRGLVPVTDVWPGCPVAPTTYMGQPHGRPVCFWSGPYQLDEQGITVRAGNVWLCGPVWHLRRGVTGHPDRYALLLGGKWELVDIEPPKVADPFHYLRRLAQRGLKINPEPIPFVGPPSRKTIVTRTGRGLWKYTIDLDATIPFGDAEVDRRNAAGLVMQFFEEHKDEVPQYSRGMTW